MIHIDLKTRFGPHARAISLQFFALLLVSSASGQNLTVGNDVGEDHTAFTFAPYMGVGGFTDRGEGEYRNHVSSGPGMGQQYGYTQYAETSDPSTNPPSNCTIAQFYTIIHDQTDHLGTLLITTHGNDNIISIEPYAKTPEGDIARNTQYQKYVDGTTGIPGLPKFKDSVDIYKDENAHAHAIGVTAAFITKYGRLTQGLVYVAACRGESMTDDFVAANARVSVGNSDSPTPADQKTRVTTFFERMDGKQGQANRPVAQAMAGQSLTPAGQTNTTLAPSVLSYDVPCPMQTGDNVTYTLDTKCEVGIVPDIVGTGCTIENEVWLNSTTLQGTCTDPPSPGATDFSLRLQWEGVRSDQNAARLDGNTDPEGTNAEGPAHDDFNIAGCAGERCMDFEGGPDAVAISSTIPGMFFTTTQGFDWVYGDKTTGNYNVHPYGSAAYVCNGNVFAWLGPNQGQGRIDFTGATARKISMLTSTYSGLWLRAYDENGQLLDSDYAPNNLWTLQLSELTVNAPSIAYVLVHDAGNYWLIDDLCVEDLLGEAEGFMAEGAEPAMEILDVIAHGASATHLFNNPALGVLYVILHWFGSEMSLTIYEPDGSLYGEWQTGYPPILVAINQAQPGNWQFDITAVDVPEDDYPYALVVGAATAPPDSTPPVVVIHSPIDGKCYFNTSPVIFAFSAEDPESGVSELTAVLDGTTPIQDGQDTLISDLGNHSFRVVAVNGVGLADTAYAAFNVNGFRWLAPINRHKDSLETETVSIIRNSTLPIKFTVFDSTEAFVADTTVRVVVEGTTAEFHYGQRDTCVRIDDEDPEEAKYIVNLHTNFRHWDYGIQIGEPYFIKTFFDDVLAHKVRLVVVDPPASKEAIPLTPSEFSLTQNFPNPFNPVTTISFNLPIAADYELVIYNVMGQVVSRFNRHAEAGFVDLEWDGAEFASGIYLYKLTAGNFSATRKMLLLK